METTIKNFKTAFVAMIDKMNEAHDDYCATQMVHNEPVPDQPPQLALLISIQKDLGKIIDQMPEYIKNYKPTVTPEMLKKVVCETFGVSENVLFERTRKREICNARQCYAYLMDKIFNSGASATGRQIGLDHATILHAKKVVNNFISTEKAFKNKVDKIEYQLRYDKGKPQLQSVA